MGFIYVEERYLIISLQESKGNGTTRLCTCVRCFREKTEPNINGLKTDEETDNTDTNNRLRGTGRPRTKNQHALQSQIVLDNPVN